MRRISYRVDLMPGELLMLIGHNRGYIKEIRERFPDDKISESNKVLRDEVIESHQKRLDELEAIYQS